MAEIQVQRQEVQKASKRELYAMVAYYYNQYNLEQASKLPARDLFLLVKTARKLEALRMYNLTNIVAAPQTKNGSGVKKLLKHFKDLSENK